METAAEQDAVVSALSRFSQRWSTAKQGQARSKAVPILMAERTTSRATFRLTAGAATTDCAETQPAKTNLIVSAKADQDERSVPKQVTEVPERERYDAITVFQMSTEAVKQTVKPKT